MAHYVTHPALLSVGFVSPMYLADLGCLVAGQWMVLAGGAELMGRDVER